MKLSADPQRRQDHSLCSVDAGGVPADWVEVTPATCDQPTIVLFSDDGSDLAADLALSTGARVLRVGPATVAAGVAAWMWLLGEGCDVNRTAFVAPNSAGSLAFDVLLYARECGLPLPCVGAWCADASEL